MRIFWVVIVFLLLFINCKKITDPIEITPEYNPIFLEGQQIPGTELVFPLGFFSIEARPNVSPNGNFVVYKNEEYIVNPTVQPGLYVLNLMTSQRNLLVADISARSPDWSPDGEWIAFNEGTHIFKIKANGDSLTKLTTQGRNFFPDWNPDGQWIAYDRSLADASGPGGLWVMKNDGSDKRWIGDGREPDWHPSNQVILCTIWDSSNYQRIGFYQINPDSLIGISDFKNKTVRVPEYSPDGSRITLYTPEEGIWIIDADGSNAKPILPNYIPDECCEKETGLGVFAPSWYPDSRHIIYEHFEITRYENPQPGFGPFFEGFYSFYKVNVDSALIISNLP